MNKLPIQVWGFSYEKKMESEPRYTQLISGIDDETCNKNNKHIPGTAKVYTASGLGF